MGFETFCYFFLWLSLTYKLTKKCISECSYICLWLLHQTFGIAFIWAINNNWFLNNSFPLTRIGGDSQIFAELPFDKTCDYCKLSIYAGLAVTNIDLIKINFHRFKNKYVRLWIRDRFWQLPNTHYGICYSNQPFVSHSVFLTISWWISDINKTETVSQGTPNHLIMCIVSIKSVYYIWIKIVYEQFNFPNLFGVVYISNEIKFEFRF